MHTASPHLVKRYHCTEQGCRKAFTTNAHLVRHGLYHSGVRKHRCDVPGCTSTFYRSDAMKKAHRRRYELQHGYHQWDASPEPMSPAAANLHPSNSESNIATNNANLLLFAAATLNDHHQQGVQPQFAPPSFSTSYAHPQDGETQQFLPSPPQESNPYGLKNYTTTATTTNEPQPPQQQLAASQGNPELNYRVQAWLQEQAAKRRLEASYRVKIADMVPPQIPQSFPVDEEKEGSLVAGSESEEGGKKTSISFLCD
ncbi:hypothetical protein HDU98_004201 [Podochytrium sp. JEL0797]|nr:hypothetical protein HDU98_004201 [Podochytrium sp. JEL0797]